MIVKPGYKTTEWWAALLASAASWIAQWAGTLQPRWAAIVTGVAAGGYALSRGLAKLGAYYGAAQAVSGVAAAPPAAPAPVPVETP